MNSIINENNYLVGLYLLGILSIEEDLLFIHNFEFYTIELRPLAGDTPYGYNGKMFDYKGLREEFKEYGLGFRKLILVKNGNPLSELQTNYRVYERPGIYSLMAHHLMEKFKEITGVGQDTTLKTLSITLLESRIRPSSYTDIVLYMEPINVSLTFSTTKYVEIAC